MPPAPTKPTLLPHTFDWLPGFTTHLVTPPNRDFQRARALAHLETLTGELAQRPPLPDDDSNFTRAIKRGATDMNHLRELASDPTHQDAMITVAMQTRHKALKAALLAHTTGLADFFIFDNGRVALDDGTIGKVAYQEGAVFFTPHNPQKPVTAFTNANTPKHSLSQFLDNRDSGKIVHNGKTYFFSRGETTDQSILVDENGQEFCVLEQGGKFVLQEDHTGFITKVEGFNRVLAAGAYFYYLGENGLHPAIRLMASGDPLFFAHTPEGSVLIDSNDTTPCQPGNILPVEDEHGQHAFIIDSTLFYPTEDPEIIRSQTGGFYFLLTWSNGTHQLMRIPDSGRIKSFPFERMDGKYIELTNARGSSTYCMQWGKDHGPHSVIWPKALQQNWNLITPSGPITTAQSLVRVFFDNSTYVLNLPPEKWHEHVLPLLIPIGKNRWDIAFVDSTGLTESLALGYSHIAIQGMIFEVLQNESGVIELKWTKGAPLPKNTVIPVCSNSHSQSLLCPTTPATNTFRQQLSPTHSPLDSFPLKRKGNQWLPESTREALGHTWTVHQRLVMNNEEYLVASHPDALSVSGTEVRLLKVSPTKQLAIVHDGSFKLHTTGLERKTYELYVSHGRVWDVSRIQEQASLQTCLGNQETMDPGNILIFRREGNQVRPLSLREIQSGLRKHSITPTLPDPDLKTPHPTKKPYSTITLIGSHAIQSRLTLSDGTGYFHDCKLSDYALTDNTEFSCRYLIPHPDDPHAIRAKANGYYLPGPEDIQAFHKLMQELLPDIALQELKTVLFYPGTCNQRSADFAAQKKRLGVYAIKANSREEWLEKVRLSNIIQHEINGHGRQNNDPGYLDRIQLGMLLDGATMVYGEKNRREYDAVLAEYLGHPEYWQIFVNGMALFYGQMERDRLKTQQPQP